MGGVSISIYLLYEVIATPNCSSGGSSGVKNKHQYSEYRDTGTSHNTLVAKCWFLYSSIILLKFFQITETMIRVSDISQKWNIERIVI